MESSPHANEIPEKFMIRAQNELRETEDRRESSLIEIRELIKESGGLYNSLSDEDLLIFLRYKKFYVQDTFTTLEKFRKITIRGKDVGVHFSIDQAIKAFQKNLFHILPNGDHDGATMIVFNIRNYDTREFAYADIFSTAASVIMASLILYPVTQISGAKLIADLRGATMRQILSVRISIFRFACSLLVNCVPIRTKGIYLVNEFKFFKTLWEMVRFMFPHKIQDRVFFLDTNPSSLLKYFNAKDLPKQFDGSVEYDQKASIEMLQKFKNTTIARLLFTGNL